LRAINLFFSQHPASVLSQRLQYSKQLDFPIFGNSGATAIELIFQSQGTAVDNELMDLYDRIRQSLPIPTTKRGTAIWILLTFSDSGRPTYQVFPGTKHPSSIEFSQIQETFLDTFFRNFAVHYIQSDKRFNEIYDSILLPSIKHAIADHLSPAYETVKDSIRSLNEQLNKFVDGIGLASFSIKLSIPEVVADLIKNIEFRLEDETETELASKGMGIQAIAL
jgi:hypothetical protein